MIKTYLFLSSRQASIDADPLAWSGEAARELVCRYCPAVTGYVQSRALAEQLDAVAVPPYAGIAGAVVRSCGGCACRGRPGGGSRAAVAGWLRRGSR